MNAEKRAACVLLLCAALLAATAHAEAKTMYYVAVSSTSYLNVRERPTTNADVVTTFDRGAEIAATGTMNGLWVEVQTESVTISYHSDGTKTTSDPLKGWVMLSMLSIEQPFSDKSGVVTGNGRVRLRDNPDGSFMKWMQPGDQVGVLAVVEFDGAKWYRVRHGDDRGWLLADYLEIG